MPDNPLDTKVVIELGLLDLLVHDSFILRRSLSSSHEEMQRDRDLPGMGFVARTCTTILSFLSPDVKGAVAAHLRMTHKDFTDGVEQLYNYMTPYYNDDLSSKERPNADQG